MFNSHDGVCSETSVSPPILLHCAQNPLSFLSTIMDSPPPAPTVQPTMSPDSVDVAHARSHFQMTSSTSNSGKRKRSKLPPQATIKTKASQKPNATRGNGFGQAETNFLLLVLENYLPLCADECNSVHSEHAKMFLCNDRTVESLKEVCCSTPLKKANGRPSHALGRTTQKIYPLQNNGLSGCGSNGRE